MLLFQIFIPLILALLTWVHYRQLKTLLNPFTIISWWWLGWCWLSNFAITGAFVPSAETQIEILLMITALSAGAAIFGFTNFRNTRDGEVFQQNIRFAIPLLLVVVSLPVIFYFIKAMSLLAEMPFSVYRTKVFSTPEQVSVLFGSAKLELLFALIIMPLMYFLLFSTYGFSFSNGFKWLTLAIATSIIFILEAIMRMGRFNYYYLLVTLIFATGLIFNALNRKLKRILAFSLIVVSIVGLASITYITSKRKKSYHSTSSQVFSQLIDYHTYSFILFDQAKKQKRFNIDERTYGRLILAGPEYMAGLFMRKLGFEDYRRDLDAIGNEMQKNLRVGKNKEANAFYAVFYGFYRDFGTSGFVIYGLIFGFILRKIYFSWQQEKSAYYLSLNLLALHIGIFSIFQNQFDNFSLWIAFAMLFLLERLKLPLPGFNKGAKS